jgi:hypothetical protein
MDLIGDARFVLLGEASTALFAVPATTSRLLDGVLR